jgi:uncharacterized iron-regulated membrane protein
VTLRRVVFWLHLGAGCVAGLVILSMSFTGVLLAYERQMLAWSDRHQRVVPPGPDARRLGAEALLGEVGRVRPEAVPSALTLSADPEAPAVVSLGRGATVLLDPYTGRALDDAAPRLAAFFRTVTDWHRWLGAPAEARGAARAVTGACNLAFLFLVVSGPYLWWPRTWNSKAIASVVLFRRNLRGRARDFNWHNVIGIWSALPLAVVVGSAVFISYAWATDLLYAAAGVEPPPRRPPAGGSPGGDGRGPAPIPPGLDAAWRQAEARVEGWKTITLRIPRSPEMPASFTIDRGRGTRPDLRAQLTVDIKTGATLRFEPYATRPWPEKVRAWTRWLHTGEAGGVAGQTAAALASAGATFLVWTGLALALRRLRAWRARRAVERAAPIVASTELVVSESGGQP